MSDFPVSLYITARNLEELRAKVANALGDVLIPEAAYAGQKQSSLPKSEQKASPADKTKDAVSDVSSDALKVEAEAEAQNELDYERDVKPRVLQISRKFERAGVEELLKPFGVANAKLVPAEQYAELIAAADLMLGVA
jgi:hypothetical protein